MLSVQGRIAHIRQVVPDLALLQGTSYPVSAAGPSSPFRTGAEHGSSAWVLQTSIFGDLDGIVNLDARSRCPFVGRFSIALVRRSECVPNLSAPRPTLAIHWLTRRAY
jgi:hypothetical protein